MTKNQKKAIVSAGISAFGVLITNAGVWLGSGHLDVKILVASVTTALSSFLIAVGRIISQEDANKTAANPE